MDRDTQKPSPNTGVQPWARWQARQMERRREVHKHVRPWTVWQARRVLLERRTRKRLLFAFLYGAQDTALAEGYGLLARHARLTVSDLNLAAVELRAAAAAQSPVQS